MAQVTFTPPKQWEDWVSWILGIWLCVSPWALVFANESPATENAVLIGFLLILTEIITLSAFEPWEEWLNVALGAWLVICPWVLGPMSRIAAADFVAVGILIVALALYELRQARTAATPRP